MTDKITCAEHGPQDITYVCQHLVHASRSGDSVGFFCSRSPRGDAWCAACDEVRIREGGAWNERSEEFAGIKVICGACYDGIKSLQGA